MKKYFRVRNWETYQHYKDRNPPWIKLYNYLLEDYDFSQLSDNSKLHLMLIWMLASRMENTMPYDANWIKSKIDVNSKVNLNELLEHNYIELCNKNNELLDASTTLADCKQDAIPERETEREQSRGRMTRPSLSDVQHFIQSQILDYETSKREGEKFFNYYESNGWKAGKNPMKDWQAAARNWIKRSKQYEQERNRKQTKKSAAERTAENIQRDFEQGKLG